MKWRYGIMGENGACGKELIELLPITPIFFPNSKKPDFSNIDVLFTAIPSEVTRGIVKEALSNDVRIIDFSSAYRKEHSLPIILPTVNSHLINNSLKIISLPNCVVAILLTALAPLHKKTPIKRLILSTYQAASGAGNIGMKALKLTSKTPPFPHPLKDNLFLHESKKNIDGLCEEEENIIFETRKILNTPTLPISVRCVRVPIKRCHSIHATVTFEQKIHNIEEILSKSPYITINSSPNPLSAEKKHNILVGDIREDKNMDNTYDFWITGDQLLRGASLNAYEVFLALESLKIREKI